jgi:hypothetical protein
MEHICKLARAIRIQAFLFVLQRVLVATQRRNRKMIETVGTSGYLGRILSLTHREQASKAPIGALLCGVNIS